MFVAKAEISNDLFDELVSQGNYSAVFNGNVSSRINPLFQIAIVKYKSLTIECLWFQIIAETLEARKTLQEVQDRHLELLKLEKSIQELREMFVEMAMLVEKQVCKIIILYLFKDFKYRYIMIFSH